MSGSQIGENIAFHGKYGWVIICVQTFTEKLSQKAAISRNLESFHLRKFPAIQCIYSRTVSEVYTHQTVYIIIVSEVYTHQTVYIIIVVQCLEVYTHQTVYIIIVVQCLRYILTRQCI